MGIYPNPLKVGVRDLRGAKVVTGEGREECMLPSSQWVTPGVNTVTPSITLSGIAPVSASTPSMQLLSTNGDTPESTSTGDSSTGVPIRKRMRTSVTRPAIVSVEGIPGSGKSELLDILQEHYSKSCDVVVIREPKEEWEQIKMGGKSLLDLYYGNRCEYSFAFQLFYFLIVERQLQDAIRRYPDHRVLIFERSLLSAQMVYEDSLRGSYQNEVKSQVYDKLFEKEGVGYVYPDQMVILDKHPEDCLGKISRLDWKNEEVITLEYLRNLRSAHKEIRGMSSSGGFLEFFGNVNRESMLESIEHLVEAQSQKTIDDPYFDDERPKPLIISIEGNIGAGKSTFIDLIQARLTEENITDIRVMKEPVDEWLSVCDSKHNILELFYHSPSRYAMPFQALAAWTTMRNLYRESIAHPECRIIICERSLMTSQYVFERMLFEEGQLDTVEHEVLMELYNDVRDQWMLPVQSIYLEEDPKVCLERIGERGRAGEDKIDLAWLERCQEYHERLWDETGRLPKRMRINNLTDRKTRSDPVGEVLKWCRQIGNDGSPSSTEEREEEQKVVGKEEVLYIQLKYVNSTSLQRIPAAGLNFEGLSTLTKAIFESVDRKEVYFEWQTKKQITDHIIDDVDLVEAISELKEMGKSICKFEVKTFDIEPQDIPIQESPSL